jgi:uncharacterized membrane protein
MLTKKEFYFLCMLTIFGGLFWSLIVGLAGDMLAGNKAGVEMMLVFLGYASAAFSILFTVYYFYFSDDIKDQERGRCNE